MNLADAIRSAASGTGIFAAAPVAEDNVKLHVQAEAKKEVVKAIKAHSAKTEQGDEGSAKEALATAKPKLKLEENFKDLKVTSPQSTQTALPVKFELYLSPEQLTDLFKGVVATQHSVMTLRETARYLRIPGRKLEEMAQLGQIPAFLIDGKWRFARNNVEEWLDKKSFRKEMEA